MSKKNDKGAATKSTEKATVEGEGSYTATENYNAGVAKTVASGKVDDLAKKAEKALDGPEGKDLEKARKAASEGHSVKSNGGAGQR